MESETVKNGIDQMTTEERKVYDRQIRLWGYAAQNKYDVLILWLNVILYLILCIFILKVKNNKSSFNWNARFRS